MDVPYASTAMAAESESSISAVVGELSHAGEDLLRQELLAKLERRRITPDTQLPQMEFLFRMFCKPCFPRGELVALAGKAKSGKTFITSILMSLCFRNEVLSVHRIAPDPLRVLWFDTEQSEESTQDILKNRIMPMVSGGSLPDIVCWSDDQFHIFNVRTDFWQERLPMLEAALHEYHPDLVILDGIRDLVNDINDGVMAQEVIERLMHLASEIRCCIVCVLHQNKSIDDKNLRGWIGTELKNKAFEVYECSKDENRIFSLSQTDTRKYDIIDKLKYFVNQQGIPMPCTMENLFSQNPLQQPLRMEGRPPLNTAYVRRFEDNHPVMNLNRLFSDALRGVESMDESALRNRLMEIARITTNGLFYRCLKDAITDGIIIQSTDDESRLIYSLNHQQNHTTSPTGE